MELPLSILKWFELTFGLARFVFDSTSQEMYIKKLQIKLQDVDYYSGAQVSYLCSFDEEQYNSGLAEKKENTLPRGGRKSLAIDLFNIYEYFHSDFFTL